MMQNWDFNNSRLAITAGAVSIFDEQPARVEFELYCGGIVRFDTVMD